MIFFHPHIILPHFFFYFLFLISVFWFLSKFNSYSIGHTEVLLYPFRCYYCIFILLVLSLSHSPCTSFIMYLDTANELQKWQDEAEHWKSQPSICHTTNNGSTSIWIKTFTNQISQSENSRYQFDIKKFKGEYSKNNLIATLSWDTVVDFLALHWVSRLFTLSMIYSASFAVKLAAIMLKTDQRFPYLARVYPIIQILAIISPLGLTCLSRSNYCLNVLGSFGASAGNNWLKEPIICGIPLFHLIIILEIFFENAFTETTRISTDNNCCESDSIFQKGTTFSQWGRLRWHTRSHVRHGVHTVLNRWRSWFRII